MAKITINIPAADRERLLAVLAVIDHSKPVTPAKKESISALVMPVVLREIARRERGGKVVVSTRAAGRPKKQTTNKEAIKR